jgi:hypothetical protein
MAIEINSIKAAVESWQGAAQARWDAFSAVESLQSEARKRGDQIKSEQFKQIGETIADQACALEETAPRLIAQSVADAVYLVGLVERALKSDVQSIESQNRSLAAGCVAALRLWLEGENQTPVTGQVILPNVNVEAAA